MMAKLQLLPSHGTAPFTHSTGVGAGEAIHRHLRKTCPAPVLALPWPWAPREHPPASCSTKHRDPLMDIMPPRPSQTLLPGWALREDTGLIGSLHPKACGLLSLQRGGPTEAHLAQELMPAGVPEGSGTSPHGKCPKAAMPRKIKTRPLARSGVQMSPRPQPHCAAKDTATP